MADVGVAIATFGDRSWLKTAERAVASVMAQTVKPLWVHGHDDYGTLSMVRNTIGWSLARDCEWLIFLDADDELDARYVEHMLDGEGDVRWPSTLGVVDGREDDYPVLLQPKPSFLVGNHCVIGSMVRSELFKEVGGFNELPILEDWELFIRLRLAGAVFKPCPEAIYRVHVRSASRNQNASQHSEVYAAIQEKYRGEVHELQWAEHV